MSKKELLRIACCIVASTTILAACSKSEAPAEPPATRNLEPPAGQLGNAVVPRQYRLELRIDPTDDRFSGVVAIDVTFDTPSDSFWLHGKDLDVSEDSALSQRRAFTSVHAHEMAHMWFGNLVTPSWRNDIWLNESFASWMENKAAHRYWPDGEFDRETLKDALTAMAADSLAAAREIREPIAINEQIAGAFDSITYSKGGGVLAMLERYVGEEPFRAGVRLHMERHAHKTATAEDFIASLAEGSERVEIGGVFESYIAHAGVPLLSVRLDCDDEQNPGLEVSQARYAPLGSAIDPAGGNWQVPVCINFVDGDTHKSTCELLSEKKQSIALDADHCPTQVHPNADGAGYYRFSMDDAGWLDLISGVADSPAAEALVLADSLDAAFRASVVSADI